MTAALYTERNGHRTWLKWHRARRMASDPVFTGARILEGMRLGASVEIDLLVNKDRGYAVLHDEHVDDETTGTGLVADLSGDQLRMLRLRANDGSPTTEPVMLLEDLTALLATAAPHADALLQLDFKSPASALDARAIASFAQSVGPVAGNMILSSGDGEAVSMLSAAVPGLRIGFDPCYGQAFERLPQTRDFAGFVAEALADQPRAEMIYLEYHLVLEADKAGFDMIGAFHAAGKTVDAWTINRADEQSAPEVRRLLELKVDQITTDDPEGVGAMIARL